MSKSKGTLYLLPTTLGGDSIEDVLPLLVIELTRGLRHFVVEDLRSARRYLSRLGMPVRIEELEFDELNEHTNDIELDRLISPLIEGKSVGILSEAGVPAVADPGARLVSLAHIHGVRVVPLTGPSSIILALMGSGLNGQNFAFVGYLPIKPDERIKKIRQLEARSREELQTQLFIETPYRNNKLLEALLTTLHPETLLHISADLTIASEVVETKRVKDWKNKMPDLHKRPSIFGIQA